ncbi:MAG: family transporter substrate-binding protein [Sedimentibacter sp.]|nr:family transporter substrate-binding protein [Sedimentibacter sp.]
MKKFISILLTLLLTLSLFTACASKTEEPAKEEPAAEAPAAEKPAESTGVLPAIAKEDIKIGVIHIGNPADGSGYTFAHDQGIVGMQKALGLDDSQIIRKARYLSGIAAGLKTKSNLIGYVAAMGQDNSEVTGGINAFAMGVNSVNPDAKVYVKVTNSWFSPEEETNAAKALLAEGCDVIAQHCDTPNPQLEAEKAGAFGVGYNSDMSKDAPKATLTSAVWNWSAYYSWAVEQAINGTWTGENYYGGMKEGLVDIAPLNESIVAEGTKEAIEAARASLLDGSFNVFDGVIETNDGKTVGEEGKTLDDATITNDIKWYFKTVTVK